MYALWKWKLMKRNYPAETRAVPAEAASISAVMNASRQVRAGTAAEQPCGAGGTPAGEPLRRCLETDA